MFRLFDRIFNFLLNLMINVMQPNSIDKNSKHRRKLIIYEFVLKNMLCLLNSVVLNDKRAVNIVASNFNGSSNYLVSVEWSSRRGPAPSATVKGVL